MIHLDDLAEIVERLREAGLDAYHEVVAGPREVRRSARGMLRPLRECLCRGVGGSRTGDEAAEGLRFDRGEANVATSEF